MLQAIQMAESRGYSAIAVTIDNGSGIQQAAGINFESDFRAKFHILEHLKLPFIETIVSSYDSSIQDRKKWFYQRQDGSPDWQELIQWIRSVTALPIILKRVLSVEDAVMASSLKVNGIVISNHGGRSLGSVPATVCLFTCLITVRLFFTFPF